jgi:hypothetical protein
MKVIGVHIATGQLRYSVLEGTKVAPALVAKDRLATPAADDAPALMDWYETQFNLILDRSAPDRVSYRLTLAPKKNQLFTSSFPLGILNLLAYRRNLPITAYVSGNYTASRLGLQKGTDLYTHCDTVLGSHAPYWDQNQKHSVLAAWFELP